jgi:hypothetical protein
MSMPGIPPIPGLFVINSAGPMDSANHQFQIALTKIPNSCKSEMFGGCMVEAESLPDMAGSLKNGAIDPDAQFQPQIVGDNGEAFDLEFVRKLTPAETAEIERVHAHDGEAVAAENASASAQAQSESAESASLQASSEATASSESTSSVSPAAPVAQESHTGNVSAVAVSPSFDCRRAGSRVEHLICDNPALAQADATMAALYRQSLAGSPGGVAALKGQQREFVKRRDMCSDVACVQAAYEQRVRALSQH